MTEKELKKLGFKKVESTFEDGNSYWFDYELHPDLSLTTTQDKLQMKDNNWKVHFTSNGTDNSCIIYENVNELKILIDSLNKHIVKKKMSEEKLEIGIYWWIDEDTNEKVYDEDAMREEFEDKLDKLLDQNKDD
tara:strand:+ start:1701 stop:2102 length:402 start_codon:yes stop_codon:yes gene_type:complete